MTRVVAYIADGTEATIAAKHGDNARAVIANLTAESLTGSALQDAVLETADGQPVRYADVNALVDVED